MNIKDSKKAPHSEYLQASNKFLAKSNDIFCPLVKKKKKLDKESHMLKIKTILPPCLKNISLLILFLFTELFHFAFPVQS